MSLPEIVQSTLGDEPVAATVDLGGEDALLVTPTRTLVYRAEGLLSDETVTEYRHGAEEVEVAEGRRKSKVTLDYGLDGTKTFAVPTKRLDEVLHPVLAGVLNAAGITEPGETVTQTFRFSELTLVITSERVVKHIGAAVWDDDYEEFHYDDVTDLTFEEGSVATSVVIRMGGRQERFKAPNEEARAVREALTNALLSHYEVRSLDEFRAAVAPDEDDSESEDVGDFGEGPTPLSTGDDEDDAAADADADPADAGGLVETADDRESPDVGVDDAGVDDVHTDLDAAAENADVAAELAALREAVEAQSERLERQERLIEKLITELRQGR